MQDSASTYRYCSSVQPAERFLPLNVGGPCYWYSPPEFSNSTEPLRCGTFSGAYVTAIHVNRLSREPQASLCLQCQVFWERLENNMNFVRNVLAFVMLACLSLSAQQITGNIRGTVTDPSGAVIRGAAVTARQAETGLSRATTTDRDGNYVLLELPVGHYRLQVAATGFPGIRAGWHHA